MKKWKQTLALFLVFLLLMTTTVLASEETNEVDFGYSFSSVAFMSKDLARLAIDFYGVTGTTGDIDTECYIPVYNGESNQLVDVFYFPIHIEKPFAESNQYRYAPEVRITNPAIRDYRFKVIMLNSLGTLSPEGMIEESGTNEITQSNADHYKFVQFNGKISYAPLHNNETTVSFKILDNVQLFEGATDAGYTEDNFVSGTNISVSTKHDSLYKVQGLYCRVMLNILNDGTYKLWWAEPIKDYNETVTIKPIDLVTANNGNNEAEYYASETATEVSRLPLAENISVYKNHETASIYDITPGHSNYITSYRYVDTDMDGFYDTVYIDYEEVFLIGNIRLSSYTLYPDFDAMRTYNSASLKLDPDDSYTLYDMNLDFEELKEGQIIRLKQSYNGGYTLYDITVETPNTISGEVTNIDSTSGVTKYTIGGTDYRMLSYPYTTIAVGDAIKGIGYDDVIVNYEFKFNANIGVILNTGVDTTLDTEYQVKLMTQDGKVGVYHLAETVNGSTPFFSNETMMQYSLPVGSIITYLLNDDSEIYAYDVQDGYSSNTLKNGERIFYAYGLFDQTTGKLGSYAITANTVFFATDATQETVTEENVILADTDILAHDTRYNFGILYDIDRNALAVLLYEVEIEKTEEVLGDISYGVVIDTVISETFETICFLELLTQDGEVVSYPLSDRLNDQNTEFTADSLCYYFPKGELIAYRVNEKNEIRKADTLMGTYQGNVLEKMNLIVIDDIYQNDAFGKYRITDKTVLTGTAKEDASTLVKDDCKVILPSDLVPNDTYQGVGVIDAANELIFSFTYRTTPTSINPDSYPFVVTERKNVTIGGNQNRIQLSGYVNGEEMEFVVAENASEDAKNLGNGDAALYTLNRNYEISDVLVLAKKTDDGYIVLDNAINGTYDDAYRESLTNEIFLSTQNYTAPTTETAAKAVAESMMSIRETDFEMAGFIAAGKGYSVNGNILRLINANNYASTFNGIDRDYSDRYEDDRIKEYYINSNAVTYLYNAVQDKVTLSHILNAETDKTTFDYRYADQIENDDFIYVYNYDGYTKLILIVDVKDDTY